MDEWYCCPVCGLKLARLLPGALGYKVMLWCRQCHKERELLIKDGDK